MSTYTKAVKQLADANAPAIPSKPCLVCGTPTQVTTLSQYGARCFPCYERFCAGEHQDTQGRKPYASIGDPDFRGTITQRDMRSRIRGTLRSNLKLPGTPIEQAPDTKRIDDAKREQARAVAAYAKARGIVLKRDEPQS